MRFLALSLCAIACFGQGNENRTRTGTVDDSALTWIAPAGTYAARPGSPGTGQVYIVTDKLCDGTGSGPAICRWNGSWQSIGSSSGSGATNPFTTGTLTANPIPCARGTIEVSGSNLIQKDLSGSTLSTTAMSSSTGLQDITVLTGVPGTVRYDHVQISETTSFTGTSLSTLKLSMGRPGGTDDEMLPQSSFAQGLGTDVWFVQDRPQSPTLSTYSIAVGFRVTGGTGFVNLLTAGKATYEVCGYAVQ